MKINDIICETTEEDRALVSLSTAIFGKLQQFVNVYDFDDDINEIINVGKIGKLFSQPISVLDDIEIEIQSDEQIWIRAGNQLNTKGTRYVKGIWVPDNNAIVFNEEYISDNIMKSTVMHELRHALDDKKSNMQAGDSKKYFPAANKNKFDQTADSSPTHDEYLAQPGEINSRFTEVLYNIVQNMGRMKGTPDIIRANSLKALNKYMDAFQIPSMFKHGKNSTSYKRLMNRAVDMINKELAHITSTS